MKFQPNLKEQNESAPEFLEHRVEGLRANDFWELTKPRLTFLVLVTTFVGFCMASKGPIDWVLLVHTFLGTALVAGGAAVLNQFLEREEDARMKRTENRPLPGGKLLPEEALMFGAALSVIGLLYLLLTVNLLTSFLGAFTLSIYLFVYTPLKKKTPLCTLIGAIPGAVPPMMGWSGARDSLDFGAWILFSILFFWQMPHFFALARLYRDDYERGGFPMLSVLDPDGVRTGLQIVAHTILLVPASLAPTIFGMTGKIYFWGAFILNLIFLGFAFWAAFSRTPSSSRKLFLGSIFYLPFILILMIVNKLPS